MEKQLQESSSEYAISIAKLVSFSAGKIIHEKDASGLQKLAQEAAEIPYVQSVTIYSVDGQMLMEFPEANEKQNTFSTENKSSDTDAKQNSEQISESDSDEEDSSSSENDTSSTLNKKNQNALPTLHSNRPYVSMIDFNNEKKGWVQVNINQILLEENFRQSFISAQQLMGVFIIIFFVLLVISLIQQGKFVKKLSNIANELIRKNSPDLPEDETQWLESLEQVSLDSPTPQSRIIYSEANWVSSTLEEDRVFIYLIFSMEQQDDEKSAETLSLAEHYLTEAIKSHGFMSQGSVISGCLVTSFSTNELTDIVAEMIALLHLIKELMNRLGIPIFTKAILGKGKILALYNERNDVTGISLHNRLMENVQHISSCLKSHEIAGILTDKDIFKGLARATAIDNEFSIPAFKLSHISATISQQANRQLNYIQSKYDDES
ncbi:MAG: hypothetical protein OEY19_00925 [Gammaproteobacteria bacterium]|nr:hypothetical protein [Gammaproteobacteria bacterium]